MIRSIDKLREWANGLHGVYINQVDHTITVTTGWDAPPDMDSVSLRDHVNGILDDIEQEVEDGWVRLPKDAEGEVIHIGELVDEKLPFGGYAAPAPIDTMELSRGASGYVWMVKFDAENRALISPKLLRHHHAPTVEDVLREFAAKVNPSWGVTELPNATLAEYAAKLQLKEG